MIEKTWGRYIEALEALAVRRPSDDPLLRAANAHPIDAGRHRQRRCRAPGPSARLTRPGHMPAFYDLERITSSAADLRVTQAESRTALQAISHVVEAWEATVPAAPAPAVRLAQVAVVRSGHAPRALGQAPDQPAPSAAVGPSGAGLGPRR
jgi:hypothetical protein